MKSIKSYMLMAGVVVLASSQLIAKEQAALKTPKVLDDYKMALNDSKKDQFNARENAHSKKWGKALWHVQDSTTARKTLIDRLSEPIAADFGKADDGRKEIFKQLAVFMKSIDRVFTAEADVLGKLASEDLLAYKAFGIDKRLSTLHDAIIAMDREVYSQRVSDLVKQHKLGKIFKEELINQLALTKKIFIYDAKSIEKALEKEVKNLKAAVQKEDASKKTSEKWYDALETEPDLL